MRIAARQGHRTDIADRFHHSPAPEARREEAGIVAGAPSFSPSALRSGARQASLHPLQTARSTSQLGTRLLSARARYEVSLPPMQRDRHDANQVRVAQAVSAFKERMQRAGGQRTPAALRSHIEENIGAILAAADFDPTPYRAREATVNGYGKYLIYSDDNHGAPFCFQFFRFDRDQKTPVHDHPCGCTSVVVFGKVRERFYDVIDGRLVKTRKEDRSPGNLRTIDLLANHPHSIKNGSGEPAGTLHVYHMDGVETAAAVRTVFDPAGGQR